MIISPLGPTFISIINFGFYFLKLGFNMEEKVEKLKEEGWINVWCAIEVLTTKEELAEKALKKLANEMKANPNLYIYEEKFLETREVEKPAKGVDKGYSKVMEISFLVKDLYSLIEFCVRYGPSAVEILEPEEIRVKIDEIQNLANFISGLMHQFVSAGIGGLVIKI